VPWVEKSFSELTVSELYEILALRARVFVLEQTCLYDDLDGLDDRCDHLWTRGGDGSTAGALAAYLRILPPGLAYPEPSLGRVIVAASARGTGTGRALMREGLARARARYGDVPIRIAAQAYLLRFYSDLGFRRASDDYLLDGIPHLEMVAAPT
jgi:ElaA protein